MNINAINSVEYSKLRVLNAGPHDFGDIKLIDKEIIKLLDRVLWTEHLFAVVTCGTQGEHALHSYHNILEDRLCWALDFIIPNKKPKDLPNIFINLMRYPFGGIGIYTNWKYKNKTVGGFHVDMRINNRKSLWLYNGESYIALNQTNLIKYFS